MKITGIIKLDEGIYLSSDCLGLKYKVNINGAEGFLSIPNLPNHPTNEDIVTKHLLPPKVDLYYDVNWGEVISYPDCSSDVNSFALEFSYKTKIDFNETIKKIETGIEDWFIRFKENLYVVDYNIDIPGVKITQDFDRFCDFFYKNNNRHKQNRVNFKRVVQVSVLRDDGVKKADLKKVLSITSKNQRLKLEYQLLREAETSLIMRNFRKSILDSASALEIALSNTIKKNINVSRELLELILKMNNSIYKKRELLKLINITLPSVNYHKDVEELRNQTIHVGYIPNVTEAKNAFDIVKQSLNILSSKRFE
jgi:hypothetical protein